MSHIQHLNISFEDILEKIKLAIEAGDLGILEKIILKEKMAQLDDETCYVLHFLLDFETDNPPVTYDASIHVIHSLKKMVDLLRDNIRVYKVFDHQEVFTRINDQQQLATDEMRNRFIVTFYELLIRPQPLLARAILEVLEKVSENRFIFENLAQDDKKLYRRIYTSILLLYFNTSSDISKKLFLKSPFFVFGIQIGFDVHGAFKEYVQSYTTFILRENLSLNFASDIAINKTKLGKILGGAEVTVEDWVNMLKEGIEKNEVENREILIELMSKNPDILVNLEYNQNVIKQILLLYYDLVAGNFILEDDGREPVEKIMEQMAHEQGINLEAERQEHSLPFGEQLSSHTQDLYEWIIDIQTQNLLLKWLDDYTTSSSKHKALVNLFISKKIVLDNEQNISALLELTDFLKQNGFSDEDDLIYFNEQTNKFEWNK
ncbi:MAG: hypothetical protein HYV41_05525 [Candidatus Magasanikbacteria bacterium]|nr:hypothetical protein [Candidatus Magasanikbacteria bacterium]